MSRINSCQACTEENMPIGKRKIRCFPLRHSCGKKNVIAIASSVDFSKSTLQNNFVRKLDQNDEAVKEWNIYALGQWGGIEDKKALENFVSEVDKEGNTYQHPNSGVFFDKSKF